MRPIVLPRARTLAVPRVAMPAMTERINQPAVSSTTPAVGAASPEAAVKELTARFDISQPAVSQHLATLKEAGLVDARREGRCVYYRVQPRGMKPLIDWIAHYRAFWTEHVDRLEALLEKMDE